MFVEHNKDSIFYFCCFPVKEASEKDLGKALVWLFETSKRENISILNVSTYTFIFWLYGMQTCFVMFFFCSWFYIFVNLCFIGGNNAQQIPKPHQSNRIQLLPFVSVFQVLLLDWDCRGICLPNYHSDHASWTPAPDDTAKHRGSCVPFHCSWLCADVRHHPPMIYSQIASLN